MGMDLGVENIDTNANDIQCRCRCRDENLKVTLVRIRDSADRAIYLMDTCCCSDINASNQQSIEWFDVESVLFSHSTKNYNLIHFCFGFLIVDYIIYFILIVIVRKSAWFFKFWFFIGYLISQRFILNWKLLSFSNNWIMSVSQFFSIAFIFCDMN